MFRRKNEDENALKDNAEYFKKIAIQNLENYMPFFGSKNEVVKNCISQIRQAKSMEEVLLAICNLNKENQKISRSGGGTLGDTINETLEALGKIYLLSNSAHVEKFTEIERAIIRNTYSSAQFNFQDNDAKNFYNKLNTKSYEPRIEQKPPSYETDNPTWDPAIHQTAQQATPPPYTEKDIEVKDNKEEKNYRRNNR